MGTRTRTKAELKRAQKRANIALPKASDLSPAQRRARRKLALAAQTTAKKKATPKPKRKKAKPKETGFTLTKVVEALKKKGRN